MLHFTYHIIQNQKRRFYIHIFSFGLNVVLKLSRIFESIKYHIRMHVKDFFITIFFKNRTLLICFDLNYILTNVL